jgi:hypothetical protein
MSGNLVVCDVVIWSENGRLLCHDADSFATFAQKNYGIIIDLDETELLRHVKFNQEEMKKQIAAEAAAAKAAKANTT